jgi:hypothetical protein
LALPQTYSAKLIGTPGTTFSYQLLNDVYTHEAKISNTGIYEFPAEELELNPLIRIKLISSSWGDGAFLYIGYKDPRIKTFSYIYDVSTVENKVQLPLEEEEDKYEDFTGPEVILPPFYDGKVEEEIPEEAPEEIPEEDPIPEEDLEDMPEEEEPQEHKKYWMFDLIKYLQDLHKKLGMFYHIKITKRPMFKLWYENGNIKGYIDEVGTKKPINFATINPNYLF